MPSCRLWSNPETSPITNAQDTKFHSQLSSLLANEVLNHYSQSHHWVDDHKEQNHLQDEAAEQWGWFVLVWKLPDCISWSVTSSKAATFSSGCTTSSWLFTFLSTRCRVFSLHRASHSSSAGTIKQNPAYFGCCVLTSWQLILALWMARERSS